VLPERGPVWFPRFEPIDRELLEHQRTATYIQEASIITIWGEEKRPRGAASQASRRFDSTREHDSRRISWKIHDS